jgi:hypothetical protein
MKPLQVSYNTIISLIIVVFTFHIMGSGEQNAYVPNDVSFAQKIFGENGMSELASTHDDQELIESFIYSRINNSPIPKEETLKVTKTIIADAREYQLDPLFVLAMIEQESHFHPLMRGQHGEYGLMQIMPQTAMWVAKKYGLDLKNPSRLFDSATNISVGIRYFSMLNNKFSNLRLATSAYNMGVKNVRRLVAKNTVPAVYYSGVVSYYQTSYFELYSYSQSNKRFVASK